MCGTVSTSEEVATILSLHIDQCFNLQKSIDVFFDEAEVESLCCQGNTKKRQQICIESPAPFLVTHLARFFGYLDKETDIYHTYKDNTMMQVDGLTVKVGPYSYNATSAVLHHGFELERGHYTCIARWVDPAGVERWTHFDDHKVRGKS